MEDRITRVVRVTYIGLIFQTLIAIGINIYVLRKQEIEPATIIIPLATIAYFYFTAPHTFRVINAGKSILKHPENSTKEQKREFIEITESHLESDIIGGSKRTLRFLTAILLVMLAGFAYLYLKSN